MKYNRTVERTIEILDLLSKNSHGLSLSEIKQTMNIPKSSAYDIIITLQDLGMIELLDERLKIYGLGIRSFTIGNRYTENLDLIKIARPYIKELSEKLNKTVFLGVMTGTKVVYIDKYTPSDEILQTCAIGSENSLHCTSLGKALLSYAPNYEKVKDKIELVSKTENTITNYEDLEKELEATRLRGYSIDDREHREHMFCSGAPIFDHSSKVIAAISNTGLYDENKDYQSEFILIKEAAEEISKKLGYRK